MSYDGEICMDCGFPVKHFVRTWWQTTDELWLDIVGDETGILCPPCFTLRAENYGLHLWWQPVKEQ